MEHTQTAPDLIGQFRTFGAVGVAYEIIETIDDNTVKIRVLETGETLEYSRAQVAIDPLA